MSSVDYGLITESTTLTVVAGAQSDTSKIFRNIRIAFETQFNTACNTASITKRVFENVNFDLTELTKTASTTEWARGTLLPADTQVATTGTTGTDLHTGIFQIDYYCQVGVGGYSEKLDTLANQFRRGTKISAGGTEVVLRDVSLGVGRVEDAFYVRNVDVSYHAVTPARS